jgi:predicted enzyme related to lactoylglutathione lyase
VGRVTWEKRMDSIGWVDLTVGDATNLRDFYARVMGWRPEPVDMGGYADFNMCDAGTGVPAAAGGTRLQGPRQAGGTRYAVVRDPAGAVFAVFETAAELPEPPPAIP